MAPLEGQPLFAGFFRFRLPQLLGGVWSWLGHYSREGPAEEWLRPEFRSQSMIAIDNYDNYMVPSLDPNPRFSLRFGPPKPLPSKTKTMKKSRITLRLNLLSFAAIIGIALTCSSLRAASLVATAAEADACSPLYQSCADGSSPFTGHAVFLPGLDPNVPPSGAVCPDDAFKFVFSPAGSFIEDPITSTATLTGHIESTIHPGYGFDVSVTFTGLTTPADPNFASLCMGSPFQELDPSCYVPTGSVDPSTWRYYSGFTGQLVGTGNYAGAVLSVTPFMHCFQVGSGASGKNTNLGASGWFEWQIISQPTDPQYTLHSSSDNGVSGDFNLTISVPKPEPPPTPTPCGGTQVPDYWMAHSEAWCCPTIVLGGKTYTKADAIGMIGKYSNDDATYRLAAQLIAAKLNLSCANANSSCVNSAIARADVFLGKYPVGCHLVDSKRAWTKFLGTFNTLVAYNQGSLCAPACK